MGSNLPTNHAMPTAELTEVDFTLREVLVRDRIDDEERTMWQIENENMEGAIREDSPSEALEIFAACLETDNEKAKIDLEDLETESEPLA